MVMVFVICSISTLSDNAFADPVHMADAIMKGDLGRVKNLSKKAIMLMHKPSKPANRDSMNLLYALFGLKLF